MTRFRESVTAKAFIGASANGLTGSWRMVAFLSVCLAGCGRIVSQKATEQLIAGDAVDRSVAQIDFRVLMGKKIFLDTQYVNKTVPGVGFVTSDYIVSSIRQKMMCDGCLLQEKLDEADFVVEMRIGISERTGTRSSMECRPITISAWRRRWRPRLHRRPPSCRPCRNCR